MSSPFKNYRNSIGFKNKKDQVFIYLVFEKSLSERFNYLKRNSTLLF